jgi:choline dehydrogenase-like flavoprotein
VHECADVIVIGSGPAGVSAAWPLVKAGVRVLMLDASGNDPLPTPPMPDTMDHWRGSSDRWRHELGERGAIEDAGRSPKFTTPLARATLTGFAEAARLTTRDYVAVGSLAAGGLSRIWGALALAPADLGPWGAEAAAMAAAFTRVEARIGVTTPAVLTPPVERLLRRHAGLPARHDFSLSLARNAVLGTARDARQPCNACGACLQGCGRGSIYHSAQELDALRRHANFAYRPGVMVDALTGTAGGHAVAARHEGQPVRLSAPSLVLAAGTLMTTRLVLRRLGLTGMPVRLDSNPVGATAFLVPGLVGRALPRHSFGLGQLVYTVAPEPGVEAVGVLYGADTLPLATIADRLPLTRPAAMRLARALMPALVLATGYLPGRFSANRLTVQDDGAGGRIAIEGAHTADADALLRRTFAALGRQMRQRGGWQVPGSTRVLDPGADAHPTGTLPMGGTGPAATDSMGAVVGLPGVYIADGACLPDLSAHHPTLTIMANADRIGTALACRFGAAAQGHADAG